MVAQKQWLIGPRAGFEDDPPELERQVLWVEELERAGPDLVRLQLANTRSGAGMKIQFIGGYGGRRPLRWFVEDWLRAKEKERKKRDDSQHRLLWVAVILSGIAVLVGIASLY